MAARYRKGHYTSSVTPAEARVPIHLSLCSCLCSSPPSSPCPLGLNSHGPRWPKGALAIFPAPHRSWLQVGCWPLTQGNDTVKVSTHVPPLGTSRANLGHSRADSRTLLSREGLRGSLPCSYTHQPVLSLILCNTLQDGPSQTIPGPHWALSLISACLVVLEVKPWTFSMPGKCYTTELYPAWPIMLINNCLPAWEGPSPTHPVPSTSQHPQQLCGRDKWTP